MDKIDFGKVKEWWGKGERKKEIALILVVIAVVVLAVMVHLLRQYKDYSVRSSTERIDSAETNYLDFQEISSSITGMELSIPIMMGN